MSKTYAPQREVAVDPEQTFWRLARDAASRTGNPLRSYESLKAQYRSTRPDASHREYEAAMDRIARMCGV